MSKNNARLLGGFSTKTVELETVEGESVVLREPSRAIIQNARRIANLSDDTGADMELYYELLVRDVVTDPDFLTLEEIQEIPRRVFDELLAEVLMFLDETSYSSEKAKAFFRKRFSGGDKESG